MVQQGEHSTNYSSWSTYLNSSSNFKQTPICMQKNLFQNSYCYILEITPIESKNHKTCTKKHTLLRWWRRWVIQILSISWITTIYTVSSSILWYIYQDTFLKQQNVKFYNFSFLWLTWSIWNDVIELLLCIYGNSNTVLVIIRNIVKIGIFIRKLQNWLGHKQ